jgi:hypothetical protein
VLLVECDESPSEVQLSRSRVIPVLLLEVAGHEGDLLLAFLAQLRGASAVLVDLEEFVGYAVESDGLVGVDVVHHFDHQLRRHVQVRELRWLVVRHEIVEPRIVIHDSCIELLAYDESSSLHVRAVHESAVPFLVFVVVRQSPQPLERCSRFPTEPVLNDLLEVPIQLLSLLLDVLRVSYSIQLNFVELPSPSLLNVDFLQRVSASAGVLFHESEVVSWPRVIHLEESVEDLVRKLPIGYRDAARFVRTLDCYADWIVVRQSSGVGQAVPNVADLLRAEDEVDLSAASAVVAGRPTAAPVKGVEMLEEPRAIDILELHIFCIHVEIASEDDVELTRVDVHGELHQITLSGE